MAFGTRKIPKHLKINDGTSQRNGWNLLWISIAVAVLLGSMFISLKVSASEANLTNADKASMGKSGNLLYQNALGGYYALSHLNTQISTRFHSNADHSNLQQHFHNDTGKKLSAAYLLPLPENTTITRVQLRIGNRVVSETFNPPSYSTTSFRPQSPRMFSHTITDIEPNEHVLITILYHYRKSRSPVGQKQASNTTTF
ncbi:MAG: hypothetical protein COA42_13955 [Alteromonadaceae bacterium]|nr:MAG: hypothetical protein COA42_13955 [Alteromonadaceae bacterium]